jgi:hypothetical protein
MVEFGVSALTLDALGYVINRKRKRMKLVRTRKKRIKRLK